MNGEKFCLAVLTSVSPYLLLYEVGLKRLILTDPSCAKVLAPFQLDIFYWVKEVVLGCVMDFRFYLS